MLWNLEYVFKIWNEVTEINFCMAISACHLFKNNLITALENKQGELTREIKLLEEKVEAEKQPVIEYERQNEDLKNKVCWPVPRF